MAHRLSKNAISPSWSIEKFYERRKNILIMRELGGLGDMLMHRMMFDDFKALMPECHITFACPKIYIPIMQDHPSLDEVKDFREIDIKNYSVYYNTSGACGRYEESVAPYADKHRSDIWANYCGVELKSHNMQLNLSPEIVNFGKERIKFLEKKPTVAVCPISAMVSKNLTEDQTIFVVKKLKQLNCSPCVIHNKPIPYLSGICPVIYDLNLSEWMGTINAFDYVISVDSAAFHLAGGLNKPLMGIFTWADGKIYGKYFDFVLVQKHRDNGDWDCGPCYAWANCPKTPKSPKPCLTEISEKMLENGINKLLNYTNLN